MTDSAEVQNVEENTMSLVEREATIRKAERILENQQHILKASQAYARLVKTEDFQTVLTHLDNTLLHLMKDAPKRNQDAQIHDQRLMHGIASTLTLLEDLPSLYARMEQGIKDTQESLITLRSGKDI